MSSSNGVRTFALAGMGNLGQHLADDFLQHGLALSILTRDPKKASLQRYASAGAKLVAADYTDEAQLASALRGIDAVISTLGGGTHGAEHNLAKAAKAAGVKIYVPSEFGLDYTAPNAEPLHPWVAPKVTFRRELEKLGLPYFSITPSAFAEWSLSHFYYVEPAARKAVLTGDSSQRFSLTALPDIAEFTRLALTTLPLPAPGSGRVLRVQSFISSYDEMIAAAEQVAGEKFAISRRSYEEAANNQTTPSVPGIVDWILASTSDGRALLDQSKLNNDEVGFKSQYTPLKIAEIVIKQGVSADYTV